MVALQAKLADAFDAALADGAGAPANATVFAETAELGDSDADGRSGDARRQGGRDVRSRPRRPAGP